MIIIVQLLYYFDTIRKINACASLNNPVSILMSSIDISIGVN